jgi:hypothetical protein
VSLLDRDGFGECEVESWGKKKSSNVPTGMPNASSTK